MSRTALFAAGAASLAGVAACSSSTKTPDAAIDTMTMPADSASDSQNSDSPSEAKDAQPTDAPRDFGGAIPIYSAVFPPTKTRIASTQPAPTHHGRSARRSSR